MINMENKEIRKEFALDNIIVTIAYFICIAILTIKFVSNNIDMLEQVKVLITLFALILSGMLYSIISYTKLV